MLGAHTRADKVLQPLSTATHSESALILLMTSPKLI